jgi:hypothetical protein
MVGIFTYVTGNWELLGNGLKDRKIPPRGRKWKGRLNSPGKGRGARTGIFTYMTGNLELLGNGLKDRKISPRGRKWKRRLNSLAKGGGAMAGIFTYMTGNWVWNNARYYWEMD